MPTQDSKSPPREKGEGAPMSRLRGMVSELKTAGLALLGAVGAFTFSMEASQIPAVAALLAVSAIGWHRLLVKRLENELVEFSAQDLSDRYGWGSVVQAIPPIVFLGSTYMHSRFHFGLEEVLFIVAAFVTAVPTVGFAFRSLTVHRLAEARGHGDLEAGDEVDARVGGPR